MSDHEHSSELAAEIATLRAEVAALRAESSATLRAEVAALRAESSAARAVRRRSRLAALVPILSLLCIISLSLVLIPTTRAQTPVDASAAEKAQPASQPPATTAAPDKVASPNDTGQALVVGQVNQPTSPNDTTTLRNPSSTQLMPNTLKVDNYSTTSIVSSLIFNRRVAIVGSVSGVDTTTQPQIGVIGAANTGIGVYGYSPGSNGYGVFGESPGTLGDGVFGTGGRYGGYFTGNIAPIRLYPSATAGPPTTGQHDRGELVVSSDGHLWFCRTSGMPGAWVRLDLGSTFVPLVQR